MSELMNKLIVTILIVVCPYAAVTAQTVSIPVGQQAKNLQGITVPVRWMTEGEVESRFGNPLLKSSPVGRPAISFWEYENYFVYFENDRVLHTVLRKQ